MTTANLDATLQSMTAIRKLMTGEEFLAWCLDQEGKWELVNGVPIEMMAGATENHDRIVVNLIATLRERLRVGPCRPKTADQAARIPKGNFRRPDVTIDCGPPAPQSLESTAPAVFFEVLSPSTRTFDLLKKPEEYKTVPTLKHFVLLDSNAARASLWTRGDDGWTNAEVDGPDAVISLGGVGVNLTLAEIYDGVELTPA